ncbi:MAG: deoxyribodipyrimidine photo-lyase/cryptochrome family protein [Bdellovibrionales bacterium]
MKKSINIVWFKKDLRVDDHKPLVAAMRLGESIGLFVVEDSWLKSPEYSPRHLSFAMDCLRELDLELKKIGVPLMLKKGDALSVFSQLDHKYNIKAVFSHEETGLQWTYKRDIDFGIWCKERSIEWTEYPQFAVIRGLKDRDKWNSRRNSIVKRPVVVAPTQQRINDFEDIVWEEGSLDLSNYKSIQIGGSAEAKTLLASFLNKRGERYSSEMSSPVKAFDACSRISPHLSWGAISLPMIHEMLDSVKNNLSSLEWQRSLRSFESRLWWHCHFIQKLESEPEIEFENMNPGFNGMRESDFNEQYFDAWKKGETGFPLIDASMRALHETGWINFRMRAMLISFASYQLWLHWRKPAQYLASLFTDFEPGIHFSQVQMQSGVTGINAIRIYSPIKQAKDQDPEAKFIKKYCPELAEIPDTLAGEPWALTPMEQMLYNTKLGSNYPDRIVDPKESYQFAKSRIFEWRSKPEVKELSKSVYKKHGSRKNSHFPSQNRKTFGNFKKGN